MITVVLRGRNVKVHSGFQKAAAELYHCFVLWRADQPDKVMLTGHSMGAAVAAMMAMLSEEDDPERIEKLCCVAMPRLGNKTLRRVFDEQFTRDRYRMYGRKLDPICHLPWFGYARAGHITWLPSKFDMRLDHAAKKYVALIKD